VFCIVALCRRASIIIYKYTLTSISQLPLEKRRTLYIVYTVHCSKNSKHTFPEMKLRGLVPNFYMHVSGSDLYIPTVGLIWNLYFPVLRKRTLGSTAGSVKRAGYCRQAVVGSSSLPPLRSCSSAESSHKWSTYKFPIRKIMDHKWKQLILVVNFLFGLRMNEIPNKKFILDSLAGYGGSERDGPPTWHDLLGPLEWEENS